MNGLRERKRSSTRACHSPWGAFRMREKRSASNLRFSCWKPSAGQGIKEVPPTRTPATGKDVPMSHLSRRKFLKTVAAAATVTIAGTKSTGRVLGANEVIRGGVAGIHGRGASHL